MLSITMQLDINLLLYLFYLQAEVVYNTNNTTYIYITVGTRN